MPYLYPLAAVLIWGGNAVVTKASAGVIGPAEITFWRWVVALAIMTPAMVPALPRMARLRGRDVARLAVLGLLGGVGFPMLSYLAALHTSALSIGILQALMPLMALLLTAWMLHQRMAAHAVAGAALSLLGVAIVVSEGAPGRLLSQAPNLGDVLMIAAVLCFAVYSVLLRRWPVPLTAFQSLYVQTIAAVLAVGPLWLGWPRTGLDAGNLGLVLYAGALASLAAPLAWMLGVAAIGPARAAMLFNLIPVVAAVLAVLLLGEALRAPLVLGGALVLAGVALAEHRPRARAPGAAAD